MSKKKKSKTKGNKLSSWQLKQEVLRLLKREPKKSFNPKQVSKKLKVVNNKDSVQYAMERLAEEGKIVAMGDYKFKVKRKSLAKTARTVHEGIVDMTKTGAAYIICEDLENDVYISPRNLNTALNKDRVKIKAWVPSGRNRPEGEVLQVLERANEHFLGTLYVYNNRAVVLPDTNTPLEIAVEMDQLKGGIDGDKVVVKVMQWTSGKYKGPLGKITTVLGGAGTSDIEMKGILINNGFQLEFPDAVIRETAAIPEEITEEEIAKRRDFRPITTFTIDPDNARDFDDALSIQYLDKGEVEIGVHIADVTHYVKAGQPLDKEALDRSTSVYLVDRVLPMLPEKLSNNLCSLRPNEDRLCFSAVFKFDKNGKIYDRWFGKGIIHSDRRFTYNEAQEVLDTGEGDFAAELKQLNKMSKRLRKDRFKHGAIDFETDEVKFKLDEEGTPIGVYLKERKDAHMLIEDFMLLANREVATFIALKGKEHEIPFVYRVHDEPDPDKVEEFARFARELGFELNISSPKEIARSYNRIQTAEDSDHLIKILGPIAIRTMAKAIYSTDNIGHYGLAFENYTHFTSPIRRYSDVLVHRLLEKNLGVGEYYRTNKTRLEEKCEHISAQERRATDAERESIRYKQVEFMEKHVGDIFAGYVTGIIDRGLFVELKDNRCEGLMLMNTMDEPFDMGPGNLKIVGRHTGKTIKMGDDIMVKIVATDLRKRQIEMAWVPQAPDDVMVFE